MGICKKEPLGRSQGELQRGIDGKRKNPVKENRPPEDVLLPTSKNFERVAEQAGRGGA